MPNSAVSGALLGLVSGLLVGLATSAVAGVAVTGLVGVAAAIIGAGSDSEAILMMRWREFNRFAASLAIAFAAGGATGYLIRIQLPTPAEALEARLRDLQIPDLEIARVIAETAANAKSVNELFGTSILYGNRSSGLVSPKTSGGVEASEAKTGCVEFGRPPWDSAAIERMHAFGNDIWQDVAAILSTFDDLPGQKFDRRSIQTKLRRVICGEAT